MIKIFFVGTTPYRIRALIVHANFRSRHRLLQRKFPDLRYYNNAGENIEELFTRVAVVAFENVLMKEVEAEAAPPPSNGQLAKNSTLIGKIL